MVMTAVIDLSNPTVRDVMDSKHWSYIIRLILEPR